MVVMRILKYNLILTIVPTLAVTILIILLSNVYLEYFVIYFPVVLIFIIIFGLLPSLYLNKKGFRYSNRLLVYFVTGAIGYTFIYLLFADGLNPINLQFIVLYLCNVFIFFIVDMVVSIYKLKYHH